MVKKNSASDKKRSAEYNRIKSNLFKKAREFSILCEVPVCTIIYPENEDDQTQKPEVFSVNCGSEVPPDEIIQRYLAVPEEEKRKRSRTGTSTTICENDPNLTSVNQDYGANNECSVTVDQMLDYLDSKIDYVNRKIAEKQSESQTQIILNNQVDSSSSYPVYPAHRKLWVESGEGRTATTHTHEGEHGQMDYRSNNQVGSHVDHSYSHLIMDDLNSRLSCLDDQITGLLKYVGDILG